MPRALSQFRSGQLIKLLCRYSATCNGVAEAKLKNFDMRLANTPEGHMVHCWKIEKDVPCPDCKILFRYVIIASNGSFRKPTIYGHEPEPS